MTHGEIALVAFVFGLVYVAAFVPRFGAFVGRKLAGHPGGPRAGSGGGKA
jgi:hypothetical protein